MHGDLKNISKEIEVSIDKLSIESILNVTYSQPAILGYSSSPLKMDILRPRSDEKYPAVVFVTGGGFLASNKGSYIQQRLAIAEAGYVVASIEYRVAPASVFPSALEDVKAAIRFLRANSEKYNIDKSKIAIMGDSAGGYLSAFAGLTNGNKKFDKDDNLEENSDVQAVVDIYGLSDLTQGDGSLDKLGNSPQALWINGCPAFTNLNSSESKRFLEASPINYIDKNESIPPFLIMHGDADTMVSPEQTRILHEALINVGVDSTRYIVKDADHAGIRWVQPKIVEIIIEFLDRVLKRNMK